VLFKYLNRIIIIAILFTLLFIVLETTVIAKENSFPNDNDENDKGGKVKSNDDKDKNSMGNNEGKSKDDKDKESMSNDKGKLIDDGDDDKDKQSNSNIKGKSNGNNKNSKNKNNKKQSTGNSKNQEKENSNNEEDNSIDNKNQEQKKNNVKKSEVKHNKKNQNENKATEISIFVNTKWGTYSSLDMLENNEIAISSQNIGLTFLSLIILLIGFLIKGNFIYLIDKKEKKIRYK
jgi:ABC-type antimicrobial peptide transport system permease subunit